MTYREAVASGTEPLELAGVTDSELDAWYLLQMVCRIERSYYYMHGDEEVSEEQQREYEIAVQKRSEHIPLQYIIGEQEFMGLKFKVNPNVLIPRQDTETLVEEALKVLKPGMQVLDLCTGSGCILISLMKNVPDLTGIGSDVSKTALLAAKENAKQYELAAEWIRSDLFDNISGKYDMILDGRAMVSLLGAFAGIFYGENAQKGFSMLNGKTGERIASDKVTLRDDALLKGGYGTQPFDSEGVSGKNKAVIEKGVLKTLLYNRKTAKKDGVQSTGNGFKAGLTGSVKTATTNFYLTKGEISQEELFRQMGDGLFITSLMGLHAGTNAVSGDFSLSAEGFRIEGGKQGQPVEQITIAGNFYKLLEAVEEIADDLYFGSSGIGSPSVLIRNLDIAGN